MTHADYADKRAKLIEQASAAIDAAELDKSNELQEQIRRWMTAIRPRQKPGPIWMR